MNPYKKTNGIILKKLRTKANDQIVVIFTQDYGKLYLIAKGAQKITSRRIGYLDSLNIVKLNLIEKGRFSYLKEIELLSSLQSVKNDYEKKKYLLLILEIIDKLTATGQVEKELYQLLQKTILNISRNQISEEKILLVIKQILKILGYYLEPNNSSNLKSIKTYIEALSDKPVISREL